MQDQIYKILSSRSGKPLRQIIRDTKRTDFYLDAQSALDYGLIDAVVAGELPAPKPAAGGDAGRGAPTVEQDGRARAPDGVGTEPAGQASRNSLRRPSPAILSPDLALVPRRAPLFEQARGVAGHRMQRRRPAERARARAADHLIERQRVGVRAHLGARFLDRHVPHVRLAPAGTA